MNLVVLTLHDLRDFPFLEWAAGENHKIFILADAESQKATPRDFPGYAHVEFFPNHINNGLVDKRVIEIFETQGLDRILAFGEDDIIRAARLREYLGLPGQDVASAQAFRCKVTMKERVSSAGVRVPAYRRLSSPVDLLQFSKTQGYPLFVKPSTSSGSTWGRKISNASELEDLLGTGFKARIPYSEYASDLIVESFVDGALHHVDGFWNGESMSLAVASRYLSPSLDLGAMSGDVALMSATLADNSELAVRLLAETDRVLRSLPSKAVFPFHAEFFVRDSQITFCEIACRTGGARVASTIEQASGHNLNRLSFLSGMGRTLDLRDDGKQFAGWTLLCPPHTQILKSPTACPYEWVKEYKTDAKEGDQSDHRHYSGDKIASAVVVGRSTEEVSERLSEFNRWFMQSFTNYGGGRGE